MKIKSIPIQQLPSGDVLTIKTYTFLGEGEKEIYIQANIHGPELTGIMVVKKVIEYFKKRKGSFSKLTLVPSCNPMGLNDQIIGQQTGYVNHLTGKNWNRIYIDLAKDVDIKTDETVSLIKFTSLLKKNLQQKLARVKDTESKLALTLQELSFDADIVIDLHTAWGKAPHYVYSYPQHSEGAKKFDVKNLILLEPLDFFGVFDEAQLYPYFKFQKQISDFQLPKEVYTFELGNDQNLDKENIENSFNEVFSYLSSQKIVDKKFAKSEIKHFDIGTNKNFIYYYAPKGGLLLWDKKPGDFFKKGEVIATIYSLNSEEISQVKANEEGKLIIQFNNLSVFEGQQICKVLTKLKKI